MYQDINKITHIYRIDGHPIQKMPKTIQIRYLEGLACVCYDIADGDPTMGVLYTQWGYSIVGKDVSDIYRKQPTESIKQAISLNRIGLHFFRCKHEFYYDCYYLVESYNANLLPKLSKYLSENGKSIFTKAALEEKQKYFVGESTKITISEGQKAHRQVNLEFEKQQTSRVLVVATVFAGKSTMINALIGYNFNKIQATACTNRLCEIYNKPVNDGISYYSSSSLLYDQNINSHSSDETTKIGLHFKSSLGNAKICLIDTPGVNNSIDQRHWKTTTDAIASGYYDMILFVSNGQYNGTIDERNILEFIYKKNKRPIIFALNQLDRFKSSADNVANMLSDFTNELKSIGFKTPKVFPVSAQFAYLSRLDYRDEDEELELEQLKRRFSKDFYDLPKYIGGHSEDNMGRSGISHIEIEIKKLNQQY